MIAEYFKLVLRSLTVKKGRTFLTILGIVIGIFTFTFFVFVSQGLNNAIVEQFSSIGLNTLVVKLSSSGAQPGGGGLTDTDIQKIKKVASNYEFVAPAIFYMPKVEFDRDINYLMAVSYPDEYFQDVFNTLDIKMYAGKELKPGEKGAVMIGYKVARDIFSNNINIGDSILLNGKKFRVIGIIKERGDMMVDKSIFMNFNDIKKLSGENTYSVIRINYYKGADLNFEKKKLLKVLNPNPKVKKYDITSPSQMIKTFNQILGLLTAIIIFISSVALVVGSINVMNTMYSNIIERINEISVMKAIGARNSDIFFIFLIESALLGFIGGLTGFVFAFAFAKILSVVILKYAGYVVPIYFNFIIFLEILFGTTILTSIFGTYPAIKAAHINPADNLRDE